MPLNSLAGATRITKLCPDQVLLTALVNVTLVTALVLLLLVFVRDDRRENESQGRMYVKRGIEAQPRQQWQETLNTTVNEVR